MLPPERFYTTKTLSRHRAVGVSAGSPASVGGPQTLRLCAQTADSELWHKRPTSSAVPFLCGHAPGNAEHAAKFDHSEHIPAQSAQVTTTLRVQESLGVPAEPLESSGRPLSRAPVST
jgi:hypothetical protein